MWKSKSNEIFLFCDFIDSKKDLDIIFREFLCERLQVIEVPPNLLIAVVKLYHSSRAKISTSQTKEVLNII